MVAISVLSGVGVTVAVLPRRVQEGRKKSWPRSPQVEEDSFALQGPS
jgi:hypothetical protein